MYHSNRSSACIEPYRPITPPSYLPDLEPSSPRSIQPIGPHAAFVLLAEFNIDSGSGLKHQYPHPTGTSEHVLADLMLPDGAHDRHDDWTVFFLNQTPRLTVNTSPPMPTSEEPVMEPEPQIAQEITVIDDDDEITELPPEEEPEEEHGNPEDPLLALAEDEGDPDETPSKLLYVISLVRTKKDTTVRRGAVCKALAVCSPNPYIQIFKPILLLALEDYFVHPSIDCLARLYNAINAMDTMGMPRLSRFERVVLRGSERPDIFAEKFSSPIIPDSSDSLPAYVSNNNSPNLSLLSTPPMPSSLTIAKRLSDSTLQTPPMPSLSAFVSPVQRSPRSIRTRTRSSTDSTGSQSQDASPSGFRGLRVHTRTLSSLTTLVDPPQNQTPPLPSSIYCASVSSSPSKRPKDTHYYDTRIEYSGKSIPVRVPLQTFPEEVGEYSLIKLIQTFSVPNALNMNGPYHPHLHSSGVFTHPIILLFNALVTHKRIMFLGHGLPAGAVSQMVLAACALGSGCGGVLKGFVERAFPYSNLTIYEDFKSVPGYISGVTNPIFESHTEAWDVFCNIETGKITVSKDIILPFNPSRSFSPMPPERSMTEMTSGNTSFIGNLSSSTKPGAISEEPARAPSVMSGLGISTSAISVAKPDATRDSIDCVFMEDIISAIALHFGELIIRARFTDYVRRFVRVASRWEEEHFGTSSIGIHTKPFTLPSEYLNTSTLEEKIEMLGSGPVFTDEAHLHRELSINTPKIEAWRETRSYRLYRKDYEETKQTHFEFDAPHQLSRLRVSRNLDEVEVQAMFEVLVAKVRTHQEIIEILSHAPLYLGGLSPFAFGLFHPSERIRQLSVEFIRRIESHPAGQKFFQGLNAFHRLAYQRQAHYLYKTQNRLSTRVHGMMDGFDGLSSFSDQSFEKPFDEDGGDQDEFGMMED